MGPLTLIQSGFFSTAASGRWAFSGWRGLLVTSSTTVMAGPGLTRARRAAGASRPAFTSSPPHGWQAPASDHRGHRPREKRNFKWSDFGTFSTYCLDRREEPAGRGTN